jgi:hypothetical protein
MSMRPLSSTLEKRRSWHRQLSVFVCLLALAFALFGHIETPEARSLNTHSIVVMNDHIENATDHDAEAVLHQCMHQSQCTLQAVLPSDHAPGFFSVTGVKIAAGLFGSSRAISPHRHPPKAGVLR